jgi:hypothetical protein
VRKFSVRRTLTLKGRVAAPAPIRATLEGSLVYDHGLYDHGFNLETAGDHAVWHTSGQDVFRGGHH